MFDSYEAIFARRADSYQRAMAACPSARDAEFREVVEPLDAAARTIFDMPAGAGYLRRHLPAGTRYVAVEPAAYFFELCPVDASAERIHCPIEAVPCGDAKADAIISLAGLHHAPDLPAVFAEFRRLLRADGMLIIADVGEGTRTDRFLNSYVHANSPMGHEGRFLGGATAPLLEAAGFRVVADEELSVPWRFAHAEEAGAFGADLFGVDGPGAGEVAEALREFVGISSDTSGVRVNWSLRRIISRAA